MSLRDLLERLADCWEIEDILYVLKKDKMWLLRKIKDDIFEHRQEFFDGDEYYSETFDDE